MFLTDERICVNCDNTTQVLMKICAVLGGEKSQESVEVTKSQPGDPILEKIEAEGRILVIFLAQLFLKNQLIG